MCNLCYIAGYQIILNQKLICQSSNYQLCGNYIELRIRCASITDFSKPNQLT